MFLICVILYLTIPHFFISGFGAFGADPFAADDDEEEHHEAAGDEAEEAAGDEAPEADAEVDTSADAAADEGVELIADEDESHHDAGHASYQDTIVEEEEPAEDAGEVYDQGSAKASDDYGAEEQVDDSGVAGKYAEEGEHGMSLSLSFNPHHLFPCFPGDLSCVILFLLLPHSKGKRILDSFTFIVH